MKTIDADALIENYLNHSRTEFEIKNCCMTNENVLAIIQNSPTVHFVDVMTDHSYLNSYCHYRDPEPNKYVSRIDNETIMLECPECKCRIISTAFSYAVGSKGYSFCPYCGVDLRCKEVET